MGVTGGRKEEKEKHHAQNSLTARTGPSCSTVALSMIPTAFVTVGLVELSPESGAS